MACIKLCGSVHTTIVHVPPQIPLGFVASFSFLVLACIGSSQCEHTITIKNTFIVLLVVLIKIIPTGVGGMGHPS